MKKKFYYTLCNTLLIIYSVNIACACSTFKLQKDKELIYGHNLNEADLDVPGMVFINKRGIFKNSRTMLEMMTKWNLKSSDFSWISRYGSVTFNNFGKDFPDGGINEAGLYIWEMNENSNPPKNRHKPKTNPMNWIQYILDNCSSLDEAIQCAYNFQIDGAFGMITWHYFISDSQGNCAALAFIDGKVKVNKGTDMPVAGLFNTPYDREMEILKYYKGFGGQYEIELNNPRVPRFVKAAVLLNDYKSSKDIVKYGFEILKNLTVDNEPEWSVIIDAKRKNVYFKTRINKEIKHFSMDSLDFSNKQEVQILDMDIKNGGNVLNQFKPYTNERMRTFLETKMKGLMPANKFNTFLIVSLDEFVNRFAFHSAKAELPESQYFTGTWKSKKGSNGEDLNCEISLTTNKSAVAGTVRFVGGNTYNIDHIYMCGHNLVITYITQKGAMIEIKAILKNKRMKAGFFGTEDDLGYYTFRTPA